MPEKERSQKVEAIVLRHRNWGETDRLLVLYTRENGKVHAIAKGIRKPQSRKAGHLEPFMRSRLLLALGRDFWLVTQAETSVFYPQISSDLVRTGYAAYITELVDRFTTENDPNAHLYSLFDESLKRIAEEDDPYLAVRYGEIHLLDLFGFRPELFYCVKCNQAIQAVDQFFSAHLGGVVCPDCGMKVDGARLVNMETLKYLRHLQRSAYPAAKKACIPETIRQAMDDLMQHYITSVLERKMNTPAFLQQIKRKDSG